MKILKYLLGSLLIAAAGAFARWYCGAPPWVAALVAVVTALLVGGFMAWCEERNL